MFCLLSLHNINPASATSPPVNHLIKHYHLSNPSLSLFSLQLTHRTRIYPSTTNTKPPSHHPFFSTHAQHAVQTTQPNPSLHRCRPVNAARTHNPPKPLVYLASTKQARLPRHDSAVIVQRSTSETLRYNTCRFLLIKPLSMTRIFVNLKR